jgi:site-specific DNA-methyltransferase (adenine-specific)
MGSATFLAVDQVYQGRAEELLDSVEPGSVALSVWSPPYFVGKSYEKDLSYGDWLTLLRTVIAKHHRVLKPGGFLAINIADILCFADDSIPRFQAENLGGNRLPVTRQDILRVLAAEPDLDRYQIAKKLGVSEQTVDRRLKNNNVRGGKYAPQTRVNLVGGILQDGAYEAGLYLYDRRVWVKDPCWENSRWHTNSYRAVDEFEYVYVFWKPGITTVNREKLSRDEWVEWGSRAVWSIPSVRANDDHEAKFPLEIPRRLIRLLTEPGETVLDCFLGSGTSAVAARLESRHFIGIEKEQRYAELARRAVATVTPSTSRAQRRGSREADSRRSAKGAGPATGTLFPIE